MRLVKIWGFGFGVWNRNGTQALMAVEDATRDVAVRAAARRTTGTVQVRTPDSCPYVPTVLSTVGPVDYRLEESVTPSV